MSKIVPLWYKVHHRQLSYREFLDRYNDKNKLFSEQETVSLFLLSALYDHDPYINGQHVLHSLIGDRKLSERAVKYFYLYWVFGRNFRDESILSGNNMMGTFRNIKINLPNTFNEHHIYDWIRLILSGFFGETTFFPPDIKYKRRDMEILQESLRYTERVKEPQFEISDKTEEKMYKLSKAHSALIELKQFFQGTAFPRILHSYRDDKYFFQGVVDSYWPSVLKTFVLVRPFNDVEIRYINEAHRRLYDQGDIDFFLYYLEQFNKFFDSNDPLVIHLKKYLEPSNESDRIRVEQFLRQFNPIERMRYLPQLVPVSDDQIVELGRAIQSVGVTKAFAPYLLENKRLILDQIERTKSTLVSQTIFSNQNSIFLYRLDDLVLYLDGKHIYVFLPEELAKLSDNTNPYNRQLLPDYIMEYADESMETESFEDIWSKVLRREVNLQSVFEGD